MRKSLKVAVVLALIIGVYVLKSQGVLDGLTLENLKANHAALEGRFKENPTLFIAAYAVIYIVSTAISLPGATVLTLAAGALFGFWLGTLIVSVSSTIGATLSFLVARFVFRDAISKKFPGKIKMINDGVQKDGAFYLFTLRLIPAFPFFLINLLMGLTSMKTVMYFFVSQIGMLPGTMAYVNAGTELGKIESLKGILSPNLIISFVIIGILPLISKKIVDALKARKLYRNFKRPLTFDYNLIVIGAGSAGLVSSYIAAAVKAKVALIEKHKMGGDCLNTGCVPSKALIRSAKLIATIQRSKDFGLKEMTPTFEFSEVMERVQKVIKKVEPHDSIERYSKLGVDCIQGAARIVSPFEVEVNGKTLTTRSIIIATGAGPLVPPIPGLDKINYLTSDSVWSTRELPKRLIVLGGGPIGCELAQCFQRLGSNVTLVEMAPRILIREDEDISRHIFEKFRKEGIHVLTSHKAKSFQNENDKKTLLCEKDGQDIPIEFDEVLVALGRKANTKGFGVENLGIEVAPRGTIESDPFLRTNFPNIFVCGDVAGPYQFTHTAAHQAWYASVNALFRPFVKFKADCRVIPWCTFTDPEVARVGINELEAKEKKIAYEVTRFEINDLDRAIADGEDHGIVKVLTVPGKDRILGACIVGSHAGDIISEYVAAMKHGFGMNKILGTIHIYPTLAEANKYAAGNWKRAHVSERALSLLRWFHEKRRRS